MTVDLVWKSLKSLFWLFALLPLALAAAQEPAAEHRIPERSEIEQEYRWATENIFPDAQAWEQEFEAVRGEVDKLVAAKGTLNKSPEDLLAVLKLRDGLEPRLERVYVYASLLFDQDTRDGECQKMLSRVRSMAIDYGRQMAWFEPELTQVPFKTIERWMKELPDLALYAHYFDDLYRQKKYILSEREEELLALAGEVRSVPGSAYSLLANADLIYGTINDESGQKVELDDQAFYKYMRSSDRRVRQDAYNAIVGAYAKVRNASGALLNGAVQEHLLTVKARGYESCLAAALEGSNIPTEVYTTLVSTVDENLPLLHRYQAIRRKALKLEDGVHAYDLFAPLVTGVESEYTYEQAVETVLAALQPLGDEYGAAVTKGFASRWVDVYATKGKRSGAYSSGTFLTQPYILLNFHGSYEDVSTLAHEMGHSMHSYFSRGTQPYVYSDYDTFCAEVASVTNELLLQDYVLKQITDPKMKLYLLVEFLETFRGTVFRQTMFSEFEHRIHEMAEAGQPLTADTLCAAYREIMTRYYGPDYVHDDLVDNYWIRIPHFYYNFYVYKYATSYCAAANISRRILAGEPDAVDRYLTFLKGGGHEYPIELLKGAGVDMSSPQPVQDAMKLFADMLDQTEKLLEQVDSEYARGETAGG